MILAIGVDTIEIRRIRELIDRHRDRFLERVFSAAEQGYCNSRSKPAESFAARYAAKEAVMKCLGSGWADGVGFTQIEVQRQAAGAVAIALHGRAAVLAQEQGIRIIHLSLSHDQDRAIAFAIAES